MLKARLSAGLIALLVLFALVCSESRADDASDNQGSRGDRTHLQVGRDSGGRVSVSASQRRPNRGSANSGGSRSGPVRGSRPVMERVTECVEGVLGKGRCRIRSVPAIPTATPVPLPRGSVREQALRVAASVHLPTPTIGYGPDPAERGWTGIPVGFVITLWVDGRDPIQSSATDQGLTVALRATPSRTVFTMGDGGTTTCAVTSMHEYLRAVTQPLCSYVYQVPSPDRQPYTITATTHWEVEWTAGTESGVIMVQRSATTRLQVGELHSLVEHHR